MNDTVAALNSLSTKLNSEAEKEKIREIARKAFTAQTNDPKTIITKHWAEVAPRIDLSLDKPKKKAHK